MKTFNKSAVLKRAWKIYRAFPNLTWSICVTRAWAIEKENAQTISPTLMNKILNGLRTFNRSRTMSENKPLLAGTQEHFKILNSKCGRKIMKLPIEDDSKQMLSEGELVLQDILHQRRLESKHFTPTTKKLKTTFRNRIINLETCQKVNINDYI